MLRRSSGSSISCITSMTCSSVGLGLVSVFSAAIGHLLVLLVLAVQGLPKGIPGQGSALDAYRHVRYPLQSFQVAQLWVGALAIHDHLSEGFDEVAHLR